MHGILHTRTRVCLYNSTRKGVTKGSAAYELRVCSLIRWQKSYFLLLEHYGALLVIFCCAQLFLLLFANLENSKKHDHLHHLDK
jgi:hypothetical protein